MPPPFELKRRKLLKGITTASLIPLLGSNLIGCSDSDSRRSSLPLPEVEDPIAAEFLHGIASGDPLGDRVILWTRVTPERDGDVSVSWEIATDEEFTEVVGNGEGITSAAVDYTVKVDAQGLEPGRDYYFRFGVGDTLSATGRTRTAGAGAITEAKFAVVSCSNYPAGYFNIYREIANRDVDAVLHLGDYIYEYEADGFASDQAEELGRVVEPATELLSLDDYRQRYAQYHQDEDLQACHQRHPFIAVWDDHEIANDAWREGAENHDEDTEGAYAERRAAAIQAWYEWLPVRPPSEDQDIIYRRLQFGDLLDLLMLDTRLIGRDEQVDYTDFINGSVIDADALRAATGDSNRTLLGETQLDWLKGSLTDSTARWQVLGQQVLMLRQTLPEPMARALALEDSSPEALAEATAAVFTAVQATAKPPELRTEEEQAVLDNSIPFNPDAWDGYSFEREDVLEHARQLQSRLVVFAGDTHNAWASQLTTADGTTVGVELACPSVSSPGSERIVGEGPAAALEPFAVLLMEDLKFADLASRGYIEVSFGEDEVTADYRFIDTVLSQDYTVMDRADGLFSVDRDSLQLSAR